MGGDAPVSLLGPSAINSRMAELQSRLDALSPRETAPGFQAHLDGAEATPMDPFHPGGGLSGPIGGLQGMIDAAAQRNGIDPKVLTALVRQESGGNPGAVSGCGAQGLCQLMPKTAAQLGVTDPFDPEQSLEGGAKYLRQMLDQTGGDLPRALASYNAGPGRIKGKGFAEWPRESQHYVTSIFAHLRNG